jgi:hypothetical protein
LGKWFGGDEKVGVGWYKMIEEAPPWSKVKVKWFLRTPVTYIELEKIYMLIYECAAAVRFRT